MRTSYATTIISRPGGFSDADLAIIATTLDQYLLDCVGHDVEFVPSPAASSAALTPRMTYLQSPNS